jgi:predicted dehydrogenase
VLTRLAELGFRRMIVEKPLTGALGELAVVEELRSSHGLEIVVVTHWLAATLTSRLSDVVRSERFGPLLSITVDQDKPRFGRSARTSGHPSAFDVEIPHSLALALSLGGPAELVDAGWVGSTGPLGGAWLSVRHREGCRTTIRSDLTSPVRRRQIVLGMAGATVTGHFPVSGDDHHAQLRIGGGDREVFEDEALSAFLLACHRHFAGTAPEPPGGFTLHASVVRLLAAARLRADRPVVTRAG